MTTRLATPTEALIPNLIHRAQAGAGRFMVTLCILDAPVPIRPPQSPLLKPFTFFMTRAAQPDGSKRLYLNMGYFDTLADAQRWAVSARRHYPGAFATIAPGIPSRVESSETPAAALDTQRGALAEPRDLAPLKDASLSDTQVLRILEARASAGPREIPQGNVEEITLLGPDDTGTRRALKEAVVQGAPVSFAVQLRWSAEPIDLRRVPPLAIFSAYTLYATETRRNGRCRYFLRLGFFADPLSAKQVAVQVRSTFDAAAVVPVIEPEITRAREAGVGSAAIPYLVGQPVEQQGDLDGTTGSSAAQSPSGEASRRVRRSASEDRQAIGSRARGELWAESDALSRSGVRHLRVEALDDLSGRWKRIRLSGVPPHEEQFHS